MRSHPTYPTNPLTIIIQHERNRYERHAQEAQQTTRPRDTQLVIHGIRKERKRSSERTPDQIIPCVNRGDVFWVGISEIRQHGHEEQEGAHAEEGAADNGHNPVDRGARGPAEPEEADGDEKGANEGRLEADFGAELTALIELRFDVLVIVEKEGDHDDEGTQEDAEEGETFGSGREAVDPNEDYWEALEPEVEQSVDQCDIEIQEKANGLRERQGKRPDENHHCNLFSRHSLGLDLRLALHLRIFRQRPNSHCPPIEDVATACLRKKEEQEDEAKSGQPHQFPNRPLPTLILGSKSPNKRAQSRPEHSRYAPHANAIGLFFRLIHIGDGGATGSEHGTADEAGDEAESEEHTGVRGVNDW